MYIYIFNIAYIRFCVHAIMYKLSIYRLCMQLYKQFLLSRQEYIQQSIVLTLQMHTHVLRCQTYNDI